MDWKKDKHNIGLLLVLYVLQGIPLGLSSSIPIILQGRISYSQQALFSLVSLPFSVKLFWAPIVDSIYFKKIGRRKSWLIPVQLICGALMIWGGKSDVIDFWIGHRNFDVDPSMWKLSIFFLIVYFLIATQDIAVDGWALTMLSNENKEYVSVCNSVGQSAGYFVSFVGFLVLNSHSMAKKFRIFDKFLVDENEGIITLGSFLRFWGIVMISMTIFIAIFKPEFEKKKLVMKGKSKKGSNRDPRQQNLSLKSSENQIDEANQNYCGLSVNEPKGVTESYSMLLSLFHSPMIRQLIYFLLTCRIAFAATDAATQFKMVEYGMKKDNLALIAPILLPVGIFSPLIVGKFLTQPNVFKAFRLGFFIRIGICLLWMGMLPLTSYANQSGNPPNWFLGVLIFIAMIYNVSTDLMYVSQMAFFAKISDPAIGGTYMTLLNTISNLGNKWPQVVSLYLLDYANIKICHKSRTQICTILLDGYYVEVIVCSLIGVIWHFCFRKSTLKFETLSITTWRIKKAKSLLMKSQ